MIERTIRLFGNPAYADADHEVPLGDRLPHQLIAYVLTEGGRASLEAVSHALYDSSIALTHPKLKMVERQARDMGFDVYEKDRFVHVGSVTCDLTHLHRLHAATPLAALRNLERLGGPEALLQGFSHWRWVADARQRLERMARVQTPPVPDFRRALDRELDRPLLTDDLTLRKTYIDLRGFSGRPRDPICRQPAKQVESGFPLRRRLQAWIDRADPADPIRLILGGPGYGKSSALRVLAWMQRRRQVVFVPLSRLPLDRGLSAGLAQYLSGQLGLRDNPWEPEPGERYLVVFDGLDELGAQGGDALEIARRFPQEVLQTLPRDPSGGPAPVLCILSGRDYVLDAPATQDAFPPHAFVHVLPLFTPPPPHAARASFPMTPDLRDRFWQQLRWAETGRRTRQAMPDSLRQARLEDLTSTPLNNVLLWVAYQEHGDRIALWSRARLFEEHTRAVFERRYDRMEGALSVRPCNLDEFEACMREAAVCAWESGGRRFLLRRVQDRCQGTALEPLLKRVLLDHQDRPGPGLVLFYARTAEDSTVTEPAIEFALTPFCDYLVVRRILWELRAQMPTFRDNALLARRHTGVAAFADLCAMGPLTPALYDFLQAELDDLDEAQLSGLRQRALTLLEEFFQYGGIPPVNATSPGTRLVQNCLSALFWILSATSRRLGDPAPIPWGVDHRAAMTFHQANTGQNEPTQNPLKRGLSWLNLDRQMLNGVDFRFAEMEATHLNYAKASGALFPYANLADARADKANFEEASFHHAHMVGFRARGALMGNASLAEANLMTADLKDAQLGGADLRDARLHDADLRGTVLGGARLEGTDLTGAWLTESTEATLPLLFAIARPEILDQPLRVGPKDAPTATDLRRLGWRLIGGRLIGPTATAEQVAEADALHCP